jgi:hypothetical protein
VNGGQFLHSLKLTAEVAGEEAAAKGKRGRREVMAIGEEDVRRLVRLYEMRDEVEQAIVSSRSRLAAIQREISDAEIHFRELVRPTQTIRVLHWQGHDLVVRWTEAGAKIELRKCKPSERRPAEPE